jgi:hypothetical protein
VLFCKQIDEFWNSQRFRSDHFCNGSLSPSVFTTSGVNPSVVPVLCSKSAAEFVPTLLKVNVTEQQIVMFVKLVSSVVVV